MRKDRCTVKTRLILRAQLESKARNCAGGVQSALYIHKNAKLIQDALAELKMGNYSRIILDTGCQLSMLVCPTSPIFVKLMRPLAGTSGD